MRPENLQAPAGASPALAQFIGELRQYLISFEKGDRPTRPFTCADIASAPSAAECQGCWALALDGDGLGNPKAIYSDGTSWTAL